MFFMAASCLIVAESVFVGYIHNQVKDTAPPTWLHHLVMKYMAVLGKPMKRKSRRERIVNERASISQQEPTGDGELSKINETKAKIVEDLTQSKWRDIAKVIDTVCYRICIVLIITLTILILVIFPCIKIY